MSFVTDAIRSTASTGPWLAVVPLEGTTAAAATPAVPSSTWQRAATAPVLVGRPSSAPPGGGARRASQSSPGQGAPPARFLGGRPSAAPRGGAEPSRHRRSSDGERASKRRG